MHYYKFHISDWSLATNHLSLEEEAVYFRLLNYYYDTECPIPLETQMVSRRLRLGNHSETLELILNEFFEETDDGWISKRCDVEIEEYQKKVEHNKKVGKLGGRPKKNNDLHENPEITQGVSTINPDITLTINHKPLTINHNKKEKIIKKKSSEELLLEQYEVIGQTADDFIKLRKSRKAPITVTVMEGIKKQADIANITIKEAIEETILRNWQSFKADWFLSSNKNEPTVNPPKQKEYLN